MVASSTDAWAELKVVMDKTTKAVLEAGLLAATRGD